ncbi:MAG: ferredoxin [Aquificaceae bacterium]
MRIYIDIDTCTACELCYDTLPQVFANRGDGIPLVIPSALRVLLSLQEAIKEMEEKCPSGSIHVK